MTMDDATRDMTNAKSFTSIDAALSVFHVKRQQANIRHKKRSYHELRNIRGVIAKGLEYCVMLIISVETSRRDWRYWKQPGNSSWDLSGVYVPRTD